MLFNFERDHTEIYEKIDDSIEYKYLREFYLRLNSRGIYSNDISNKKSYKSIENELNSKITLTTLSCNTILSSNDENYLNYVINSMPTSLYKLFLKCSMYQMKDFAVHLLVNNWPFEKLELIDFFKEAYSSLLFFYKTDINSFTGKIAPEILKWLLISSKYTKLVTNIFLKNQIFESYKLRHLDITGLPISDRLFKELLNKYYHSVSIFSDEFNSKSPVSSFSDDNSSLTSRIVSYSDQEGNSESGNDSDFSEDISSEGSLSSASDFDFKTFFKKCLKNKEIENTDCSIKSQYSEQFNKIGKYDIRLDLILVSFNAWQKFMKIAQIQSINRERNINKANYEFKLIVNKLDITFHQQKFCLENDFLDLEVLVSIFDFEYLTIELDFRKLKRKTEELSGDKITLMVHRLLNEIPIKYLLVDKSQKQV
ncbi:unnamed protein product [Brachionus calyciflorus]|uniref:Uncharacterized protein n=1 Tax=Brachionus calyciflorus TaxID=104777 RepID=A0A813S1A6_9BILA|nr:unnamed protein product [Brachionus calyciflorus]